MQNLFFFTVRACFSVIAMELVLYGLFFVGWFPDVPLLTTRIERSWGLNPESVIVYEDNIPHRSAGFLTAQASTGCSSCLLGVPPHISEYSDDGLRLDGFDGPAKCMVGVFGDGYANGLEVSNDEIFTSLIERELREDGHDVNLLNFGLNNAGTTIQYLRYKQLIEKGYKFDHVILVFNPFNNISHNSPKLLKIGFPAGYPFFVLNDGVLVRADRAPNGRLHNLLTKTRVFLADYSHFANLTYGAFRWLERSGASTRVKEVFNTTPNPDWEEAWQVTESVLSNWVAEIRAARGSISAIIVGTVTRARWKARPGYRADYPHQRAGEVFEKIGIDYVDLLPLAEDYVNRHNIGPPYLGWEQVRHFSPLGHRLIAGAFMPLIRRNLDRCQ